MLKSCFRKDVSILVTKPTWTIHQVVGEDSTNFHTHGLEDYGSLELEINLPIEGRLAAHIINEIGLKIVNGKRYNSRDIISDVVNVNLTVIKAKSIHSGDHDSEDILRIIIPDENLRFPWDAGCDPIYKKQIWNRLETDADD